MAPVDSFSKQMNLWPYKGRTRRSPECVVRPKERKCTQSVSGLCPKVSVLSVSAVLAILKSISCVFPIRYEVRLHHLFSLWRLNAAGEVLMLPNSWSILENSLKIVDAFIATGSID